MRKNLFKKLAIFMVAVLLVVGLAGCTGKKQTTDKDYPKISVYIPNFNKANAQNIVDAINEKAGVSLEVIESGGSNTGNERSALIITTGEKVNWVNIDTAQPYKEWGKEGFLNDLSPYIKKYKDELPAISLIVNDELFKALKGDDGEIFAIPSINYITNQGIRINKEWFESTDIDMPDTTEDMLEMFKVFKEKKATEQGSSPFIAGSIQDFNWAFLAHGGTLFKNGYPRYYKENGQLMPYDISNMNKQALKYVRTMHQEGYVNPDWQVLENTTQVKDRFLAGKAGMWYSPAGIDEQLYESIGTTTLWPPAPKGPTGIRSYGGEAPVWRMATIPASVSKEEDIYNTLKFIEWMHSEEARMICVYGIEGRHYEINSDGLIDQSKYKENMDNDFARVNGGANPFEWGWVSPFRGAIEPESYNSISDAIANIKTFKKVLNQPVDENYMAFVDNINKYINPYPYSAYYDDDIKFTAASTIEFVSNFYSKAITEIDFDIDAQWEGFANEYLTNYNGQKCLDMFTELVRKCE